MTGKTCSSKSDRHQQQGAVLLIVLLFVLLTTLGVGSMVQMHQTQTRREKEEQLLFVGDQFRRAIASYYGVIPPGGSRSLPRNIDDLLYDQRFPTPMQHLRQAYPDPMTGKVDWSLIRAGAGIVGVRSQSTLEPIKKDGFGERYKKFSGEKSYAGWIFVVTP